jgi:ankyrin repeat protein
MSDTEDNEEVSELCTSVADPLRSDAVQQLLQNAKRSDPSKFASLWEMDEQDVDEATEEEKLNNPVIRILWAAETGNIEIVSEMLSRDTGLVNATDADGYTPLHRAAYEGHLNIVDLLLDNGASLDVGSVDGWTPLHSASYWGQTEVVAALIHHGAFLNAQTNGGQTPLHLAAAAPNGGSLGVIQLLLMNEFVDTTIRNQVGETAQDIAKRSSQHHKLFDIADDAVNILSHEMIKYYSKKHDIMPN